MAKDSVLVHVPMPTAEKHVIVVLGAGDGRVMTTPVWLAAKLVDIAGTPDVDNMIVHTLVSALRMSEGKAAAFMPGEPLTAVKFETQEP